MNLTTTNVVHVHVLDHHSQGVKVVVVVIVVIVVIIIIVVVVVADNVDNDLDGEDAEAHEAESVEVVACAASRNSGHHTARNITGHFVTSTVFILAAIRRESMTKVSAADLQTRRRGA